MEKDIDKELSKALSTAFIDNKTVSNSKLTPQLIFNDPSKKRKIFDVLKESLLECEEFYMSVAFIKDSGLIFLKEALSEIKRKKIKGRILTTDYLEFTEPKALKWLKENTDIEVRMYVTHKENSTGFHTKGYFFKKGNLTKIIIGSANITDTALTKSQEWNSLVVSSLSGSYYKQASLEFERLWNLASPLTNYLDDYIKIYNQNKQFFSINKKINEEIIEPNKMQLDFINSLKSSINNNQKRGLLISATGTGKTYASAFGFKAIMNKEDHLIFLAHSTRILLQSAEAYKRIFPKDFKIGIITSDNIKNSNIYQINLNKDDLRTFNIIFCMRQMMADNLDLFKKDQFQYGIIDEAHKSGSETYLKILNYFKTKFFLGMTATPERTDDPEKVFNLFNNNILLEIRLKDALNLNYLCPFHYYGIKDIKGIDDDTYELRKFNNLVDDKRIDFIVEKIKYYGYSGNYLHGLIFCSSKEDGKILEEAFNNKTNYKVKFLCGSEDDNTRFKSIELLEKDSKEGDYLDYIITINIFNEGIDIPKINQVILLRPTISSIIFIQQLGRGLRKYQNKEYVVVLDFIGNYKKNYLIAKALSNEFVGYANKDIAKLMIASSYIDGISTIEFDEISKKEIFDSISKATLNSASELKRIYKGLYLRLNRIPSLEDFIKYEESNFDPVYFYQVKPNSYYGFLQKYFLEDLTKKYTNPILDETSLDLLSTISLRLGLGKRTIEDELFLSLINLKSIDSSFNLIKEKYYKTNYIRFNQFKSTLLSLVNRNSHTYILNEDFTFNKEFKKRLENSIFKNQVIEILNYAISRNKRIYKDSKKVIINNEEVDTGFKLFELYTRDDVSQILDYGSLMSATMFGYPRSLYNRPFLPVFVNFKKELKDDDPTNYKEHFIDNHTFIWSTRNNEKRESTAIKALDNGVMVLLFMSKTQKEPEHFFLGAAKATCEDDISKTNGTFHYKLTLDDEINDDIFTLLETKID